MEREQKVKLADFVVIGAQKAGTTSLYHYLDNHPQIYLHPLKELSHFNRPKCLEEMDRYARFFKRAPRGAFRGDVSTSYTQYPLQPNAASAMAQCMPNARLIYIVRHPVKRVLSQYRHEVLAGYSVHPSLDEEVRLNPSYIDTSSYYMQLGNYLPCFLREQILVVIMEELLKDKVTWMRRIFDHIGCDASYIPTNLDVRANDSDERVVITPRIRRIQESGPYQLIRYLLPRGIKSRAMMLLGAPPPPKPKMSAQTRAWLAERLRDDTESLRQFMGREAPIWDLLM